MVFVKSFDGLNTFKEYYMSERVLEIGLSIVFIGLMIVLVIISLYAKSKWKKDSTFWQIIIEVAIYIRRFFF